MIQRLAILGAGFAAICLAGLAASYGTPDALDQRLVMLLNPDAPQPFFDAVIVAITDYSIPYVAVLLACSGLAVEAHARGWVATEWLAFAFPVLGVAIAAIAFVRFGSIFEQTLVPIVMTPLIVLGFCAAAAMFRRADDASLARVRRIFWLTLVAIALSEVAADFVRAYGPLRSRPFSRDHTGWNAVLRIVPDEYVRGRGTFPSGHAVAICALLAPAFWIARNRAFRVAIAVLAALCVYSRVYVAAHFPSDALAGALIGTAIGSLVVFALDRPPAFARHGSTSPTT